MWKHHKLIFCSNFKSLSVWSHKIQLDFIQFFNDFSLIEVQHVVTSAFNIWLVFTGLWRFLVWWRMWKHNKPIFCFNFTSPAATAIRNHNELLLPFLLYILLNLLCLTYSQSINWFSFHKIVFWIVATNSKCCQTFFTNFKWLLIVTIGYNR